MIRGLCLLFIIVSSAISLPSFADGELTNSAVVELVNAGLSDAIIIATIKQTATEFDTSPQSLIKLRKAGVSNAVIEAMVRVRGSAIDANQDLDADTAEQQLPTYYGLFAQIDGSFVELRQENANLVEEFPANVKFLLYDKKVAISIPNINLIKMAYVRLDIMYGMKTKPDNVTSMNRWDVITTDNSTIQRKIKIVTKPTKETEAVYLIPRVPLEPGAYALVLGSPYYSSVGGTRVNILFGFFVEKKQVLRDLEFGPHCVDLVRGDPKGGWNSWLKLTNGLPSEQSCSLVGVRPQSDSTAVSSNQARTSSYSTTSVTSKVGRLVGELAIKGFKAVERDLSGLFDALTGESTIFNIVVPNGRISTFRHGTMVKKLPSGELVVAEKPQEATYIHPGIDIAAEIGESIYPIANGIVENLIASKEEVDWKQLGYSLIIKHTEQINGKTIYSSYFHMNEAPVVNIGQSVVRGETVIGKVGATGNAVGSHVHVEVRRFPSRYLEDGRWNQPWNIYGRADADGRLLLSQNWEDVEPMLNPSNYVGKRTTPDVPENVLR